MWATRQDLVQKENKNAFNLKSLRYHHWMVSRLPGCTWDGMHITGVLLFYVFAYIICVSVPVTAKRVSDPLELLLQTTVNVYVGPRN